MRLFILFGAVFALLAVMLGAMGAHGLKAVLSSSQLVTFEIAVRYQMYHALALLVLPALSTQLHNRWARRAGWAFVTGIVLFSGSLYMLATMGWRVLGPVTPLGGLFFMAGWICLIIAAVKGAGHD